MGDTITSLRDPALAVGTMSLLLLLTGASYVSGGDSPLLAILVGLSLVFAAGVAASLAGRATMALVAGAVVFLAPAPLLVSWYGLIPLLVALSLIIYIRQRDSESHRGVRMGVGATFLVIGVGVPFVTRLNPFYLAASILYLAGAIVVLSPRGYIFRTTGGSLEA